MHSTAGSADLVEGTTLPGSCSCRKRSLNDPLVIRSQIAQRRVFLARLLPDFMSLDA
jgi:hypothetical protein